MEPNNHNPWIVIDEFEDLYQVIGIHEHVKEALHFDIFHF